MSSNDAKETTPGARGSQADKDAEREDLKRLKAQAPVEPEGPLSISVKAWTALGVFAAGLLLVEANVYAARHLSRFDVSESRNYSLSEPTVRLLEGLDAPVHITTLLGAGSPARLELKYLTEAYRSASTQVTTAHIDPDRQPAEYLEKIKTLEAFQRADGSPMTEAAVLIEQGQRRWLIQTNQLATTDGDGNVVSTVERSLSEGIAHVLSGKKERVCFVTGHGEASLDDAAPEGLLELSRVLGRSNVEAERVPLDVPEPEEALVGCTAVAIVGPARPVQKEHEDAVIAALDRGAGLLLFLDPIVEKDASVQSAGLDALARRVGAIIHPGFVLESDPALRLPTGLGEAFFASPDTHPITAGLTSDALRLDARALLVAAQPLRPVPGIGAAQLLHSSESAVALSELRNKTLSQDWQAPFALALAYQSQGSAQNPSRAVVVGSSNILQNAAQRDPAQYGNQIFAENAFAWVLSKKALVSVPDKTKVVAGLHLSEESLASLLRYVLLYLPLSAAAVGAGLLFRRYQREQTSRRETGQ